MCVCVMLRALGVSAMGEREELLTSLLLNGFKTLVNNRPGVFAQGNGIPLTACLTFASAFWAMQPEGREEAQGRNPLNCPVSM